MTSEGYLMILKIKKTIATSASCTGAERWSVYVHNPPTSETFAFDKTSNVLACKDLPPLVWQKRIDPVGTCFVTPDEGSLTYQVFGPTNVINYFGYGRARLCSSCFVQPLIFPRKNGMPFYLPIRINILYSFIRRISWRHKINLNRFGYRVASLNQLELEGNSLAQLNTLHGNHPLRPFGIPDWFTLNAR
ncbi:uncharacterized protein RAG0_06218 [Rhynchosporium agropyri]|uniref:Uncharacterized protein n=1 Tax=Rhynchosporium agropyri TaxID=914238 RepID=A0A1E1KGG1_9HELO|nr:uncharacterized protein RAG0_06218 [Rhynchosporium agropyri]